MKKTRGLGWEGDMVVLIDGISVDGLGDEG